VAVTLTPTAEQQAIIDAYRAGVNLVIEAGAGTGKTTTLRLLAGAVPDRDGCYIAYNRAIAEEARRVFPPHIECATAHALAFRALPAPFKGRFRRQRPRQPARLVAKLLGIDPLRVDKDLVLAPAQVARIVLDTVTRFCRSADPQLDARHLPRIEGITAPAAPPGARVALREAVVPLAQRAWADLSRPDGQLRYSFEHYLKQWQLTGPRLDVEVVLFDEAQDANPVIAAIVERQAHAQRVLVGDASQAIYGWNGAIDAMSQFQADVRLKLSESFRFGPPIAAEANKWLQVLGADLRLSGRAPHPSRVERLAAPDAILCRTNAGAVAALMAAAEQGRRAALVGGGEAIKRLAEAALELQQGIPTSHPELIAFTSWGQVREYVEQEQAGSDLRVFVRLIDDHGADAVIATMDHLVEERRAQVVVSTAHKAKGREWDQVQVAGDFRQPKPAEDGGPRVDPAEAMLAYVTVTRARRVLDRGGLAWVDDLDGWEQPGGPPAAMPVDAVDGGPPRRPGLSYDLREGVRRR
jgi:energy-coupling factor transporter ATP-binding protein EcfA2